MSGGMLIHCARILSDEFREFGERPCPGEDNTFVVNIHDDDVDDIELLQNGWLLVVWEDVYYYYPPQAVVWARG